MADRAEYLRRTVDPWREIAHNEATESEANQDAGIALGAQLEVTESPPDGGGGSDSDYHQAVQKRNVVLVNPSSSSVYCT
jgi:hypothetical protein